MLNFRFLKEKISCILGWTIGNPEILIGFYFNIIYSRGLLYGW